MNRLTLHASFAAAFAACAITAPRALAQTTATPSTAADPIRIELLGPAQWRTQFGPTNVGGLLASESASAMWNGFVAPFEGMVKGWLGLDDAAYAEARARMLDYGGAITMTFDLEGPEEGIRIAFGPDGKTDLPTLCKDLTNLFANMSGAQWSEKDGTPPMLQVGPGQFVSRPAIQGSDATDWTATFAISRDTGLVEAQKAAALLGAELHARRGEKAIRPPFHLRFDVQAAMASAPGGQAAGTSEMLGLEAMRELGLTIGTAGPQVQVQASMRFDGNDRGYFGILFPDVQGLPAIASLLPAGASMSKTGRCDFGAIDDIARKAVAASGGDAADFDESMPAAIFDEKKGVLAHFTDEYALASTAASLEDLEDGESDFVFAVRIRDHVAFAEKWKAARKDIGFTELSSEEQDGFVVQRLGGLVSVTTALGPDLLVIGYGRNVREQIDAWIAKAKDGAWTSSKPSMPQGLTRAAPDGCNGTAEGQVAMVLGQVIGVTSMLPMVLGDTGLDLNPQDIDIDAVRQLLKEHNLDVARSLTGYRDGWWRMRVFW
jgi:hypothetical protein